MEDEFCMIPGGSLRSAMRCASQQSISLAFPRCRLGLHAMVTSVGYDLVADRPYRWDGRRRGNSPFVLLQHTFSGVGRLRCGTRRFDLRAGESMLVQVPDDHAYWVPMGESWEFFWVVMNGREIHRIWRELIAVNGPVVRLPERIITGIGGRVLALLEGHIRTPTAASGAAYSVAMSLAGALLAWGSFSDEGGRPPSIARALSVCNAEALSSLTVGKMAEAAGLTRAHFTKVFSDHEGMPPGEFLRRLKLSEAGRLLRVEHLPIKAVAARTGFKDPSFFAKQFRTFYGMSPSVFRRSGMFVGQPVAPVGANDRGVSGGADPSLRRDWPA